MDVRPPAEIRAYRAISENICAEFDVAQIGAPCLPAPVLSTTPGSIGGGKRSQRAVRVAGGLEAIRSGDTAVGDSARNNAAPLPTEHDQEGAPTAADSQTVGHAAGADSWQGEGDGGDEGTAGSSDGGMGSTFVTAVGGSGLMEQTSVTENAKSIADGGDGCDRRLKGSEGRANVATNVESAELEKAGDGTERDAAGVPGNSADGVRRKGLWRLWERGRSPPDSFDQQRAHLTSAR